jgi:hypothetical protein
VVEVWRLVIGGDGVPLFSDKHPFKDGVYSNIMAPGLHFNQAALEKVSEAIRNFVAPNGLRYFARPRLVVVPIHLEFIAHRLFEEPDIQAKYPQGYCVLDFLDDPDAWYVMSTLHGLVHLDKQPFQLDLSIQDGRLVLEGSQSYGVGYNNPRAIFGVFPESDKR